MYVFLHLLSFGLGEPGEGDGREDLGGAQPGLWDRAGDGRGRVTVATGLMMIEE